jgi:ethylmalonyl-CoA mutase
MGGAIAAVESGYMKRELVKSNTARLRAIESGAETVVGVNAFTQSEPSPLAAGADQAMATVSEHISSSISSAEGNGGRAATATRCAAPGRARGRAR